MDFRSYDWRDRRNFLNRGISLAHMHYNVANYSTVTHINKKTDMKSFDEEIFTKIHSIPDPLKKNLADTVITADNNKTNKEIPKQTQQYFYENSMPPEEPEIPPNGYRNDFYQSINGITSFFSNFFGAISGAMFQRRPKSPVSQYYDCFECDSHIDREMSSDIWQPSNTGDQNKTKATGQSSTESNDNMNNCRAAVAHCEGKLNAVKSLLENKSVSNPPKFRTRRPKRVFVDPRSIEDNFEDDYALDNIVSLANDDFIQYFAVGNNQDQMFTEIDSPKMKTEIGSVPESTEIVQILPKINCENIAIKDIATPTVIDKTQSDTVIEVKQEIISSCEDKMARLKSLLLEKRKKPKPIVDSTDSTPEPVKEKPKQPAKAIPIDKTQDKRFKNPNRLVDKRKKSKQRKNIQDDMVFANEIDSEEVSSVDNSPARMSVLQRISETRQMDSVESDKEYFDEVKGRFQSASTTDSEDSFQIVFTDSPKLSRMRRPSDCESEDSYIIFEDSPDSCYTSNDIFGDHPTTDESDSECSDSESDASDSGCGVDVCKLSHSFSRTVSDLTDDSLYDDTKAETCVTEASASENDEVDCGVRTFDEISDKDVELEVVATKPGLLIDEAKKLRRKEQPAKKVSFSEKPPKVHVMRVWAFAARQARAGHWERHALDRERFKRRIADVDMAVSWVLKPQHRSRVMFQRFMPWWNAQKRKEAAEKKQKAEEDKIKKEQEDRIKEEDRIKKEEADRIIEEERLRNEEQEKIESAINTGEVNEFKNVKVMKKKVVKKNVKNVEKNEKSNEVIAVNDKLNDMKLDFIVQEKVLTN